MAFSKQLIHLRNIRGMSQEELAALMDVTRQSVSKWETNQTYPCLLYTSPIILLLQILLILKVKGGSL